MGTQITRNGPWAIVTGASQGIGEGFARELAGRGYDIVLVSRRTDRLAHLAHTLVADFGVQTRVVAADLSLPGAAQTIIDAVRDLDVGLLVSNAGAAKMGGFLQNRVEDLRADLHLNALSHLELAHAFGSFLRTRDRSGGILLVSSTAALQPIALGANYAGAKAFVHTLGESLHREFAEIDIDVTVLLPGPTDTTGLNHRTDIAMGNLPVPAMPVETLVHDGLRALEKRKASHIAGAMNRWSARLMPRRLLAWMFSTLLRRNAAEHLLPTAPIATPADAQNRSTTISAA
ncbi:MAG: SDR family NAD(P)-dependent oxidoreductase [Nannocystales bacterium]